MARKGGNPDLVYHQFQRRVKTSRNTPFSLSVEPALLPFLKAADKDMLRRVLIQCLLDQGYVIPQEVLDNYNL